MATNKLLSTGSTLLNLACSGTINGGFMCGKYHFLVGDSASGKTWLSLTCLAEAAINPAFKKYRFIQDNPEGGSNMDIARYFGEAVEDRLEPPREDAEGNAIHSETVEDFYYNVDDALKRGEPFIYILDSMDSLTSADEIKKFNDHKKASRKVKGTAASEDDAKVAGSYGDGKAKKNSSNLRRILPLLERSKSILIIINQTRDNIGFGAMFNPKTRSGGHALRFYATLEIWSSVAGHIKKTIKGKPRPLGIISRCKIKKNRLTGGEHTVDIPLYHSFGIDDIGSCINYLVDEKHWSETKGIINATDFDFKGPLEKLVKYIEANGLELDLRSLVGDAWSSIAEACTVRRKTRY